VCSLIRASPASTITSQSIHEQLKLPESAMQHALEFLFSKRASRRDGDTFAIDQHTPHSSEASARHFEASLAEPAQRLSVDHPKIFRLVFRMLMMLVSTRVSNKSYKRQATAQSVMLQLRCNRVLKNVSSKHTPNFTAGFGR